MIPLCINGKDYYDREEALAAWFEEWLMKHDFEQDLKKHKCIQKNEIAVFYDLLPRQKRARTAETHWYKVLYKRKATPEEVESLKAGEYTRRYLVYSLFIEKKMTLDKALSLIVADDKLLGIADNTISEIVTAFETFFNRKFRIYKPEFTTQLNLFTD